MRALLLVATLVLACVPATAAESYDALLARLKGGDTTIDFQALRYAYTKTPQYDPYRNGGDVPAAVSALRLGKFDDALAAAEKVLESNYVSIDAHIFCALVYARRGDAPKTAYHKAIFQGLRDSIARSGDGKSPATAYHVISVREEYVFLELADLEMQSQTLVQSATGPVDAMNVTDPQGNKQTIHFNISRPMAALTRRLSPRQ
jgi:hypothetical protein